jgi:hypothetical protein
MNKLRDPLLWMLIGGSMTLSCSAGAQDVTSSQAAAQLAPASPVAVTVAPTNAPASPPSDAAAPSGQIWECTTNGLRTFSNNPCGTKSSIRELNTINRMEAAPAVRTVHTYTSPVSPPQYSYPDSQEPVEASYAEPQRIVVYQRIRRVNLNATHPRHRPRPQSK